MEDQTKITAPQISLPKGGGAIKGIGETFQPNAFTGTATLSIPSYTTPARGFEPQLNLIYDSGSGNGVFGLGFSLSIPNISRKTEKGIPKYDGNDTFILSNAEDLVPKLVKKNGQWVPDEQQITDNGITYTVLCYRPRVEGLFAKIEQWVRQDNGDSHWRVTSKENVTNIYGQSRAARIFDPADESRTFSWLLERTYDAKGNQVLYSYKAENTDNVPPEIYEAGRLGKRQANKYLRSVKYGNYPDPTSGDEKWAFEVVFDYGEYDLGNLDQPNSNPYQPVRTWPVRSDPFSSYRAGFEVRTYRLCHNILLFHHFAELGPTPCLVRATRLNFEQKDEVSFAKTVTEVGYRRKADGSYDAKAMPHLALSYIDFEPTKQSYQPLTPNLPGYLGSSGYLLIDLYGEGIPGVLYSDGETTRYWEATGNGRFEPPTTPIRWPLDRNLQNQADYALVSLAGNGRYDLLVTAPDRSGYYECNADHTWSPFVNFESFPLAYNAPQIEMVDIDGNGLTDLVAFDQTYITIYPSRRTQGYAAPLKRLRERQVALQNDGYAREMVGFADMFGDGLNHRVRIRNGLVECWPNLGYGRFGEKVVLGNAPHFGAEMDASRLFLADVDGSGTTDLLYIYSDRVELYLNQSGNSFSDPISVPLPEHYDNLTQLTIADVQGNGTSCLVVSKPQPDLSLEHQFYDFAGNQKPYLLKAFSNNLGASTRIEYKSSVLDYLTDKQAGRPWATNLPFPVQVVAKIESVDQISGSKLVSLYKYHEGYYDPVEREFRGFGYVERWDSEPFEQFSQPGLHPDIPSAVLEEEYYVQPLYTRTWYHTGAYLKAGVFSKQYEQQYYQGDPQALQLPDSVLDPIIDNSSAETIREAYRAMKGQVIREEVYGICPADVPHLTQAVDRSALLVFEAPYTVTEANVYVRLVQPKANQKYAVFYVHPRETITYNYERNPADPRIQHDFTLDVDEYGNILQSCAIFYPRRASGSYLPPEQSILKALASVNAFFNHDDTQDVPPPSFYLLGMPCEERQFEIGGLKPNGSFYFTSFEQMKSQVQTALTHIIPFEENLTPGEKQARLLKWARYRYVTPENESADACAMTPQALLAYVEQAVFSQHQIEQVFEGRVTTGMLQSTAPDGGGYIWQADCWSEAPPAEQGCWWNRGLTQTYYGADQFYLLKQTADTFGAMTEINRYDDYHLLPVEITDPAGHQTIVKTIDYQVVNPQKIQDINQNYTEFLFDPLGLVVVSSIYGTTEGKAAGDDTLADYVVYPEATLTDICQDTPQELRQKYVQMGSTYFAYDMLTWKQNKQPVYAISLRREVHLHTPGGENSPLQIEVTFSDGFGRELQTKLKVDQDITPDLACHSEVEDDCPGCWLTTGKTVYNNKGEPVKQYEPFFSSTGTYHDTATGPYYTFLYDALSRRVGLITPLAYRQTVEFTAWTQQERDEDDNDPTSPFYNTPTTQVLDNVGYPCFTIQDNLGGVASNVFARIVEPPVTSEALWHELISKGYLQKDAGDKAWVTAKFQPYRPGFQNTFEQDLAPDYKPFAGSVIEILRPACLATYHRVDIEGLEWETIDPRLYYANVTEQTQYYNFKYIYNMSGEQLKVDSTDAGLDWRLNNVAGQPIRQWDGRGFQITTAYNKLQQPSQIDVAKADDQGGTYPFTAEVLSYGSDPTKNNVEQLTEHKDQAGLLYFDLYNIQEQLLHSRRQLCRAYKTPINWQSPNNPPLEDETFFMVQDYDALDRLITETHRQATAGQPVEEIDTTTYHYYAPGWLRSLSVKFPDQTEAKTFVQQITYNAQGDRKQVKYDNGLVTTYDYDERFRLIHLQTTHGENKQVQDIRYTYDPVGNITQVVDNSQPTIFHNQQQVNPQFDYAYDALYRLIQASGRQHRCIQPDTHSCGFKQSIFYPISNPNNGQQLENYTEVYAYDDSGNLTKTQHKAASVSWTRQMEIPVDSNRGVLKDSNMAYDPNSGNMTRLENLSTLHWDYRSNLAQVDVIVREAKDQPADCCQPGQACCQDTDQSDRDYFVYDSGGQRVRKVVERYANGGTVLNVEEKIYLGNYEIKRVKQQSDGAVQTVLDRQTLRVMDDQTCLVISHYWKQDDRRRETEQTGRRQDRYQLDNNLGSVCVEVDDQAQLISYEEYYPYGGTAIIAGPNQAEVKLKEYRYAGKERDDSTGLYYYGARYYAPWLGRWLSPDPAGPVDGLNLYTFVKNNPLKYFDPSGNISLAGTRAAIGLAGIGLYAGIGTSVGAIAGAIAGAIMGAGVGAAPGAAAGAAIGAAVGGGIGLLRFAVDNAILPLYRYARARFRQWANPALQHPAVLYNPTQRIDIGSISLDSGRAGAEMIAENEGIPRNLWPNLVRPFNDPALGAVTAHANFNGRMIFVGHGFQASDELETVGFPGDPNREILRGANNILFNGIEETLTGRGLNWANINRLDLCVCFGTNVANNLRNHIPGTVIRAADTGTTPVGNLHRMGVIRGGSSTLAEIGHWLTFGLLRTTDINSAPTIPPAPPLPGGAVPPGPPPGGIVANNGHWFTRWA